LAAGFTEIPRLRAAGVLPLQFFNMALVASGTNRFYSINRQIGFNKQSSYQVDSFHNPGKKTFSELEGLIFPEFH
jgi:hypothetical protein